jgi:AcrR family transcriptional regulator
MTDQKRTYRMTKRAEQEASTRLRITESAVELHGSIGPSRTSMSAVAAHAGVRRSTLYRHFPDEAALFMACTSHYMQAHPIPDPSAWAAIADPRVRLETALSELYAYYGRTERMMRNLLRDEQTVPAVAERFGFYHQYLVAVGDILLTGRRVRGRARDRTRAAVGHALAFGTWSSLVREQGLDDQAATELMCRLVAGAA